MYGLIFENTKNGKQNSDGTILALSPYVYTYIMCRFCLFFRLVKTKGKQSLNFFQYKLGRNLLGD